MVLWMRIIVLTSDSVVTLNCRISSAYAVAYLEISTNRLWSGRLDDYLSIYYNLVGELW